MGKVYVLLQDDYQTLRAFTSERRALLFWWDANLSDIQALVKERDGPPRRNADGTPRHDREWDDVWRPVDMPLVRACLEGSRFCPSCRGR
jgi:hypothetical protein